MNPPPAVADKEPASSQEADSALLQACRRVLVPLARLAVAKGLHYGDLDELLRTALVDAAREAHADIPPNRAVSRVSATTGLHRRVVTRLMHAAQPEPARASPATQLFTRWLSDPAWRDGGGPLHSLPRQGPGASFEALAQSVTKDVHPRTLLEEVVRLGLARHDSDTDTVVLQRNRFVPRGDHQRMLGFLGHNVGDHLSAAVDNVIEEAPRHLEQALFADQLSPDSLDRLQPVIRGRWQALMSELAPQVQRQIDEDEALDRPRSLRLRIGMYAFAGRMPAAPVQSSVPHSEDLTR